MPLNNDKENIKPQKIISTGMTGTKPVLVTNFHEKFLAHSIPKREVRCYKNGHLYDFGKEIFKYLQTKEEEFLLPKEWLQELAKTKKKLIIFEIGQTFIHDCFQKYKLKMETLLLSHFIWHKLWSQKLSSKENLFPFLTVILFLATKFEEYYPLNLSRIQRFLLISLNDLKYPLRSQAFQDSDEELLMKEVELLSMLGFKVTTPPLLSLTYLGLAGELQAFDDDMKDRLNETIKMAVSDKEFFAFGLNSMAAAIVEKFKRDHLDSSQPLMEGSLFKESSQEVQRALDYLEQLETARRKKALEEKFDFQNCSEVYSIR